MRPNLATLSERDIRRVSESTHVRTVGNPLDERSSVEPTTADEVSTYARESLGDERRPEGCE